MLQQRLSGNGRGRRNGHDLLLPKVIRGLLQLLDDDQNVIAALSYADFLGAYKAQEGLA
jgi:hypothetical protein